MTDPDPPAEKPDPAALGFKLLDGVDPLIAAAAGVKQKCIDRGFSPESGEQVAVEIMVGFIRKGMAGRKPSSFAEALNAALERRR